MSDQIGNRSALPRAFEDFVGDDGNGFGTVQLEPLGTPPPRQFGRGEDRQTLELGGRQQHRSQPQLTNRRKSARACRAAAISRNGTKLESSASSGTGCVTRGSVKG